MGPWERTVFSVGVKLKAGGWVDLLTAIGSIHNRYANLETLAVFSYELKKESCSLSPQYLGLHKMSRTFQGDLTLDLETAHLSPLSQEIRKSVTYRA